MSLLLIQDTVQQIAAAITAALGLETEIIDEKLMIIGGTGRYADKIGTFEEDGNVNAPLVYATCLKKGQEYVNFDPASDPLYDAREKELAEICCPVKIDNATIGLIGLIAFTPAQREQMIQKTMELTTFLRIMAELIAGQLLISENNLQLQSKVSSLTSYSSGNASFHNIISTSSAMQKVKNLAMQVAPGDSTILITGESGTGKGLFAHSIHEESSRSKGPFISINCAAIPEMLLESELFGYEKGSFTGADKNGRLGKFQLAEKGTIFLDEIGDMPIHLQAKLLTALQNRQIDPVGSAAPVDINVRVIAATNKNLEELIEKKQFREDLYFRLNVIPIHIPPLRERKEDLDTLLQHAIQKFSRSLGKPIKGMEPDAWQALRAYDWPGNVREVENVIEYAVNMEMSASISLSSLPERIFSHASNTSFSDFSRRSDLKSRLAMAEREIIASCLEHTGHSLEGKRHAAEILGISESTLYRRLRKLSLL